MAVMGFGAAIVHAQSPDTKQWNVTRDILIGETVSELSSERRRGQTAGDRIGGW